MPLLLSRVSSSAGSTSFWSRRRPTKKQASNDERPPNTSFSSSKNPQQHQQTKKTIRIIDSETGVLIAETTRVVSENSPTVTIEQESPSSSFPPPCVIVDSPPSTNMVLGKAKREWNFDKEKMLQSLWNSPRNINTTKNKNTRKSRKAAPVTPPPPPMEECKMDTEEPNNSLSDNVPSSLEILQDLQSKLLLAEKLQQRVANMSHRGEEEEEESKKEVTEPMDDSLIKPPKKMPTKSFVEYRRQAYTQTYAEVDPPQVLVPGANREDDEKEPKDGGLTANDNASDPHDISMIILNDYYPHTPIIHSVPSRVKGGEDVAMHEILTAINMFVSPEYITNKTDTFDNETDDDEEARSTTGSSFCGIESLMNGYDEHCPGARASRYSKKEDDNNDYPTSVVHKKQKQTATTVAMGSSTATTTTEECPDDEKSTLLHPTAALGYASLGGRESMDEEDEDLPSTRKATTLAAVVVDDDDDDLDMAASKDEPSRVSFDDATMNSEHGATDNHATIDDDNNKEEEEEEGDVEDEDSLFFDDDDDDDEEYKKQEQYESFGVSRVS